MNWSHSVILSNFNNFNFYQLMEIGEIGVCFLPALPLAVLELKLEPEIVTVLSQLLKETNAQLTLMIHQTLKIAM